MAKKVIVADREWETSAHRGAQELERGNILFFPKIPFPFPQKDIDFLLAQKQSSAKGRKNIAYKPQVDKITNHDTTDPQSREPLHAILRQFSRSASAFLSQLLPSYAENWQIDYASFRPFQEKGRDLRLRARNDLLHVDAFPTRPVHGSRILRFFININPHEARKWVTSLSFGELAMRYGGAHGVPFPRDTWKEKLIWNAKSALKQLGLQIPLRSPYDQFMLQLHNFLKENHLFQESCPKDHWEFPPNSCWAVFTDMVSHAALSGQYALEQTFLVPRKALLYPEQSPISILERLTGRDSLAQKPLGS